MNIEDRERFWMMVSNVMAQKPEIVKKAFDRFLADYDEKISPKVREAQKSERN